MDKQQLRQIRRARLKALIENDFNGRQKELALRVGVKPSHISQHVTDARGIGEEFARRLEKSCKKPDGWMDGREPEKHPLPINVELMSDLIAQAMLSVRDSMHLIDPKYIGYKVVQIYLDNVEKGIDVSQARAVIDFILRHQDDVTQTPKNQSAEQRQKQHAVLRSG